jgi:hypothetical protein
VNEMRYPLEVAPSPRGHSVGSRRIIASTKQPSRTIRATWLFSRRALWHLERGLRLRTDGAFGVESVAICNGRTSLDFRYTPLAIKLARHCNMSRWATSGSRAALDVPTTNDARWLD